MKLFYRQNVSNCITNLTSDNKISFPSSCLVFENFDSSKVIGEAKLVNDYGGIFAEMEIPERFRSMKDLIKLYPAVHFHEKNCEIYYLGLCIDNEHP